MKVSYPLDTIHTNGSHVGEYPHRIERGDPTANNMDSDYDRVSILSGGCEEPENPACDTHDLVLPRRLDTRRAALTDVEWLDKSKGQASLDSVKQGLEDLLESIHARLTDAGVLKSTVGQVFSCIFDNPPRPDDSFSGPDLSSKVFPLPRFFAILCDTFHMLSTVTASNVPPSTAVEIARMCFDWVLVETLCYTQHGIILRRRWLSVPADELYIISREGVENLQPLPINGAKPWKSLQKVDSAPLDRWSLYCGDVVNVDTGHKSAPAKVSEIRSLGNGRFVVVYCWLYTRQDVLEELKVDGCVPSSATAHLNQMWPTGARFRYMLSTNRTITIWDTAIGHVPQEVLLDICHSAIYSTTPTSRRIWSVENKRYRWMKKILHLSH